MDTIKNLFKGALIGSALGVIMIVFMFCVKTGYDHFDAFHSMIDTIGYHLLNNPFA